MRQLLIYHCYIGPCVCVCMYVWSMLHIFDAACYHLWVDMFQICFSRVLHLIQHGIFSSATKEMAPCVTYILLSPLLLLFVANIWKNFPFLRTSAYASFCFLSYAISATKLRQQLALPDNYKQV